MVNIVFITIVSSLALVIGVNAAITWITVDSAKDTETLKTLLTDRNGNVVAAKTAETTLPLIAAPVLDVATLASTDRLVITYALSPTATIEASVRVSDVFKYSDRWAEFKLASPGAGVGTVVVKDGAAEYTNTDGNVTRSAPRTSAARRSLSTKRRRWRRWLPQPSWHSAILPPPAGVGSMTPTMIAHRLMWNLDMSSRMRQHWSSPPTSSCVSQ